MNETLMGKMEKAVRYKKDLYDHQRSDYWLRSIYGGVLLTLGTVAGTSVAAAFSESAPVIGKLLYSYIFPFGLIMIIFMNMELATSNMMYLLAGWHRRWLSLQRSLAMIVVCTLGNLLGAAAVVGLVGLTATRAGLSPSHFIVTAARAKLAKSGLTILAEAVLANVFVNIAIIGQLRLRDEGAKVFYIIGVISMFVFLGYEHVVANFGLFLLARLGGGAFSWGTIISHWLISFVGNVIGGGALIGVLYSWLNRNEALD